MTRDREADLAKFFFDIHNDHGAKIDHEGHEFGCLDEVRREAQRLLPDLARHEIPKDGDRHSYIVLVRDEQGRPVYSATLIYAGALLSPDPEATRVSFAPGSSIHQ